MKRLKKINYMSNKVAIYYEGSNTGVSEPTEVRYMYRSGYGMWWALVGVWTGDVYEWLYP